MKLQKLNLKKLRSILLAKKILKIIIREIIAKSMFLLQMNFTFISKDFEARDKLIVLHWHPIVELVIIECASSITTELSLIAASEAETCIILCCFSFSQDSQLSICFTQFRCTTMKFRKNSTPNTKHISTNIN